MPVTAHCSLDKGAHWMDVEVRHAPLTDGYLADVAAMADLVDDQTVALVGSAGNYAHGLIDPIEELGRAGAVDGTSACTSTAASAAGCSPGSSASATTCRPGTSASRA